MSITAGAFKKEQLGSSPFRHSFSSPKNLSEGTIRYLLGRGLSAEVLEQQRVCEMRVSRSEKKGWKDVPVFFDEPAIAFPLSNNAFHICMYRLPKKDRWLTTPFGLGVGFFGDMDSREVLLNEGEWDVLTLLSRRIPAITASCGAGTFTNEMAETFRGKRVWVCYDADKIGIQGAGKAAKLLSRVAEVFIIDLPLPGTADMKDVTDFFVKKGGTREQFERIRKTARAV